ncbi:GNAT family N-acetyltransferase [Flavobacterium sp. CF136]|jgi:GNAT superfamily N-acetyltransferase|uniref:GNAT family N-acetyltransferase n=1 Tax=Flavobacterium sp. (strain CF136) TaxID=1144313 RepID=UPI0002717C9F|nr:GNAT family N-acetyltransferase [Flavobacterium sp. CF136]EJL63076.1 acetyltransferase, ribosomal protein N-acetylase [Flavobacterium sp. CF136]
MKNKLVIKPLQNNYTQQILNLILPIQQIEFNVPVTPEAQPDLLDIEKYYHGSGGGFWGAEIDGELVGTIALISTGHTAGAIRKMFVKKEFRGKETGIANDLLSELISYCRHNEIIDLYLGTVDMLKAAHRFYEKNGFERKQSEDMPDYFPRMMGENIYYHLTLGNTNSII